MMTDNLHSGMSIKREIFLIYSFINDLLAFTKEER